MCYPSLSQLHQQHATQSCDYSNNQSSATSNLSQPYVGPQPCGHPSVGVQQRRKQSRPAGRRCAAPGSRRPLPHQLQAACPIAQAQAAAQHSSNDEHRIRLGRKESPREGSAASVWQRAARCTAGCATPRATPAPASCLHFGACIACMHSYLWVCRMNTSQTALPGGGGVLRVGLPCFVDYTEEPGRAVREWRASPSSTPSDLLACEHSSRPRCGSAAPQRPRAERPRSPHRTRMCPALFSRGSRSYL